MRNRIFRDSLIVVTLLTCLADLAAQNPKPTPGDVGKDRVYTAQEVDVKAKVTNQLENLPGLRSDCPDRGKVSLTAVLRKWGKVTDIKLTKSIGCSFDKQAIDAVRKLKFRPALKDGQPVSQLSVIEYEGKRYSR